ncbi:MAG TPA: PilN domain-containing protein [Candidatus Elarobacter sp.]
MTRTDYAQSWTERHAGIAVPRAVPRGLRAPAAVAVCACAFVAVLGAVEHERFAAAAADGAAAERRLLAVQSEAGRVAAVERDVERLRAAVARLRAIRGSGGERAAEIAALGDRLPPGVWVRSLRIEPASLALEGYATRLDTLGATMVGLGALPGYRGARLISARADAARGGVAYAMALERVR